MLLGEILIYKKWISYQQLDYILIKQQENQQKIGKLLLESDLISAAQLQKALREQYWRKNGYWVIDGNDKIIDFKSD